MVYLFVQAQPIENTYWYLLAFTGRIIGIFIIMFNNFPAIYRDYHTSKIIHFLMFFLGVISPTVNKMVPVLFKNNRKDNRILV